MKKWLKYLGIVLVLGCCYIVVILGLIFSQTKASPSDDVQTLLVLGAQIRGATKEEAYPSPVLKERLDTAFLYWKQHPEITIVVSGGQGSDEPATESSIMASYLIEKGVPKEIIFEESSSKRTQENIQFSNERYSLTHIAIVTNDFHMYRAQMLANRQGIKQVSGLSATSKTATTFSNYLREIIALGYGLLFDW